MIDVDVFYKAFGATRAMGPDEQLMLAEGVRVQCTPAQWTVFFENMVQTEQNLIALFACARQDVHLIPFSTRSGWLALRSPSQGADDETAQAVHRLEQVLKNMSVGTTSR